MFDGIKSWIAEALFGFVVTDKKVKQFSAALVAALFSGIVWLAGAAGLSPEVQEQILAQLQTAEGALVGVITLLALAAVTLLKNLIFNSKVKEKIGE